MVKGRKEKREGNEGTVGKWKTSKGVGSVDSQ